MVILDDTMVVSDSQDISGIGSTTTVSTNSYDTGSLASGNSGQAVGTGEPIYIVSVLEAVLAGSNVGVDYISSATDALGSPTVEQADIFTFTTSDTAGTTKIYTLPPGVPSNRYLGVQYDPAGTLTDSGAIVKTFFTRDITDWAPRASGRTFL